jgi:hypothetical protein
MFENFEILHVDAPQLKISAWFEEHSKEIIVTDNYSNIPFAVCLDMCKDKFDEWVGEL